MLKTVSEITEQEKEGRTALENVVRHKSRMMQKVCLNGVTLRTETNRVHDKRNITVRDRREIGKNDGRPI